MITPPEAHDKARAFDEWLDTQPAHVKDTVEAHILTLTTSIPGHFGVDSAKILLAEVYLAVYEMELR